MAFDKTTAMRNAERHLAQGKIRSAIAEYKKVVQNDTRDFVTMNMLGDLCVKDGDTPQALKCYTAVADHYGKQGFAAKAIAVYNKITKLSPYSPEIEEKLAELHKLKGSVSEARAHYTALAEHYERNGSKLESLGIWKKVAYLDSVNTSVLQRLGDSYLAEGFPDDAVESFNALGGRFAAQNKHAEAADAYERTLGIEERNQGALVGYTEAKKALGLVADAIARLEALAGVGEFDPAVAKLLFDCYLTGSDVAEAERVLIRLVESEPAQHILFLKLGHVYLSSGDAASAARSLSLSAEHLLAAGKADEVLELANGILNELPAQIEVLRVLCDFHTWQRDEPSLLAALKHLASAANEAGSTQDERFALSQIILIAPQETAFADRLRELNELHGFAAEEVAENGFDAHFAKNSGPPVPMDQPVAAFEEYEFDELTATAFEVESLDPEMSYDAQLETAVAEPEDAVPYAAEEESGDAKLVKEIESIRFYVDNGYAELAVKAADELKQEFGDRPEIAELFAYIACQETTGAEEIEMPIVPVSGMQAATVITETMPASNIDYAPVAREEDKAETTSGGFDLSDLRSELGFEDDTENRDSDFETHYNTATAYQEMGMLETAINEYQSAVALVSQSDGTRRFFQCSNMLGHCFMQMGRPNLALTWYQRTLETPGLNEDEKQALWYELANAYEADGDHSNAARFFEKVYAENINFRDVAARLKSIAVPA